MHGAGSSVSLGSFVLRHRQAGACILRCLSKAPGSAAGAHKLASQCCKPSSLAPVLPAPQPTVSPPIFPTIDRLPSHLSRSLPTDFAGVLRSFAGLGRTHAAAMTALGLLVAGGLLLAEPLTSSLWASHNEGVRHACWTSSGLAVPAGPAVYTAVWLRAWLLSCWSCSACPFFLCIQLNALLFNGFILSQKLFDAVEAEAAAKKRRKAAEAAAALQAARAAMAAAAQQQQQQAVDVIQQPAAAAVAGVQQQQQQQQQQLATTGNERERELEAGMTSSSSSSSRLAATSSSSSSSSSSSRLAATSSPDGLPAVAPLQQAGFAAASDVPAA